jgi:predicted GIY-YIG superfamily endonuclease
MLYFVYILEMLTGQLYVGTTGHLKRRLSDHAKGFGHRTTHLGGYKRLLYTEYHPNRLSAVRRERQIKGWSRAKKLALASGNLTTLRGMSKRRR